MRFENCTFVRGVDGDTYDIAVDVRLMNPEQPLWTPRIRCAVIDTPEHGQPGWLDAKTALAAKLQGKPLTIELLGRDSFKRLIAETYVDGEKFSDYMLSQGWAKYVALRLQLAR